MQNIIGWASITAYLVSFAVVTIVFCICAYIVGLFILQSLKVNKNPEVERAGKVAEKIAPYSEWG